MLLSDQAASPIEFLSAPRPRFRIIGTFDISDRSSKPYTIDVR